jgi:ribosomal protein L37E
VAAAALVTAAAGGAAAQEEPRPSAIEHALVEYLCRMVHGPTMIGTEVYHSCYTEQLRALREPFGADLANLTRADRRSLDAWCGKMQAAGDRDAYLACLNRQLVRLKEERAAATAKSAGGEAQDEIPAGEPAAPAETIAAAEHASPGTLWLILAIAGVASAGGTAFVLKRRKRATHTLCRGCGAVVEGSGDMCANCRHEAAEARRRAVAERAEEARLQVEHAKRDAELQEEEHRREQARRDETLRLAAEVEQRRREEQERRLQSARAEAARDGEEVFDPHAVLGLAPGASPDAIRAAYEQAKAKYDPSQYEHFGVELQAHFKAKADAVERAFQTLHTSE